MVQLTGTRRMPRRRAASSVVVWNQKPQQGGSYNGIRDCRDEPPGRYCKSQVGKGDSRRDDDNGEEPLSEPA